MYLVLIKIGTIYLPSISPMIHPELLSALSLPSYLVHSIGKVFRHLKKFGICVRVMCRKILRIEIPSPLDMSMWQGVAW